MGLFIATSISQVTCLKLGLCPELAPLARTELNPDWRQGCRDGDMGTSPLWHDAVSTCLAVSVIGKGKCVDGRR